MKKIERKKEKREKRGGEGEEKEEKKVGESFLFFVHQQQREEASIFIDRSIRTKKFSLVCNLSPSLPLLLSCAEEANVNADNETTI